MMMVVTTVDKTPSGKPEEEEKPEKETSGIKAASDVSEETRASQPPPEIEKPLVQKKTEPKKVHLPTRYFVSEMITIVLLAVVFSRPYLVREAMDWAINAAIWLELIFIVLGYLAYKNAAFLKSRLPDEKSDFFFVKFRSWKMYLAMAILFVALAGIILGGSIWAASFP